MEKFDELKTLVIATYHKMGDGKGLIRGGKVYTGNEIADHVERETELGVEMVDNLIQLTIDLLKRDKINYPDQSE